MIRSMTGYGRAQEVLDGLDITVEIKSVNHRYFEFSARTPRAYGFLDEKIKSYLQSRVNRGKVDVYVAVESLDTVEAQVDINDTLAAGYVKALAGAVPTVPAARRRDGVHHRRVSRYLYRAQNAGE